MQRNSISYIFFVFLTLITLSTHACKKDPECGNPRPWASFTNIIFKQSYSKQQESMEWHGFFNHSSNDILIN